MIGKIKPFLVPVAMAVLGFALGWLMQPAPPDPGGQPLPPELFPSHRHEATLAVTPRPARRRRTGPCPGCTSPPYTGPGNPGTRARRVPGKAPRGRLLEVCAMLSERRLQVLRAIVQDYVGTEEPVGSKALTERHNLGVPEEQAVLAVNPIGTEPVCLMGLGRHTHALRRTNLTSAKATKQGSAPTSAGRIDCASPAS